MYALLVFMLFMLPYIGFVFEVVAVVVLLFGAGGLCIVAMLCYGCDWIVICNNCK